MKTTETKSPRLKIVLDTLKTVILFILTSGLLWTIINNLLNGSDISKALNTTEVQTLFSKNDVTQLRGAGNEIAFKINKQEYLCKNNFSSEYISPDPLSYFRITFKDGTISYSGQDPVKRGFSKDVFISMLKNQFDCLPQAIETSSTKALKKEQELQKEESVKNSWKMK